MRCTKKFTAARANFAKGFRSQFPSQEDVHRRGCALLHTKIPFSLFGTLCVAIVTEIGIGQNYLHITGNSFGGQLRVNHGLNGISADGIALIEIQKFEKR